jgi:histone demethylase JARID1
MATTVVSNPPAPLLPPKINGSGSGSGSVAGSSKPQTSSQSGTPIPSLGPTSSVPFGTNIPLSARKSLALDLKTVNRRDNEKSSKAQYPKSTRIHGVIEAPTFYPTEDEFRLGPIEYIKTIKEAGAKYGIVKVVPPKSWNPPFVVDTEVRLYCNLAPII